jgi:hypothetical protein
LDLAVLADVDYQIINSGFTPTPISLTAPVPLALVSGYAVAGTKKMTPLQVTQATQATIPLQVA